MKSFKELNEIFDPTGDLDKSPSWSKGEKYVYALKELSDGSTLVIASKDSFNPPGLPKGAEVMFTRIDPKKESYENIKKVLSKMSSSAAVQVAQKLGTDRINNKGAAFEALAAVKEYIEELIKLKNLDKVITRAWNDEPSKQKLYMRMAKKFSKSVEVKNDPDGFQEIVATIKESFLSEAPKPPKMAPVKKRKVKPAATPKTPPMAPVKRKKIKSDVKKAPTPKKKKAKPAISKPEDIIQSKTPFPVKKDVKNSSGKTTVYRIETSDDVESVFSSLKKTFKKEKAVWKKTSLSSKGGIFLTVDGQNIAIVVKPAKGAASATTTRMQELGSAWIIRRAIKDNIKYKSWEDIRNDPKFDELEALYPEIDDEWLKGYYAQQKKMLDEFSGAKFSEFNRDGGFMDYITNIVKRFGIKQKDTWNPADIWLIKNESAVRKQIEKAVGGTGGTIRELNAVMRKLFKERKLVGISLKKISGKAARYEEVNIDDGLELGDDYKFKFDNVMTNFEVDKKGKFGTQDTVIVVKSPNSQIKMQMKQNDSGKWSNLKWEGTQKGATSARLGKSPVDMVSAIMQDNGIPFVNNHNRYPKTGSDYKARQKEFEKMYNSVKSKAKLKPTSAAEFSKNMIRALDSKAEKNRMVGASKLMQLDYLSNIFSLNKSKLDTLLTDLVFVSMKKGASFGPFGKLY